MRFHYPDPYFTVKTPLDAFIIGMLEMGNPLEISLVGAFDERGKGRGSRQDMDLPLHRDGVYSKELADAQGGHYVEKPGVDIVGLYCIRGGGGECFTLVGDDEVRLEQGQGLVFDNRKVLHGRRGPVGERLLMRIWINQR